MAPATGAGQTAPSDAPHAYVDQQTSYDAGADAGAAGSAQEGDATGANSAQNAGIEKDVGTILAGLNQEQLASIVAAAVRVYLAHSARVGLRGPAVLGHGRV